MNERDTLAALLDGVLPRMAFLQYGQFYNDDPDFDIEAYYQRVADNLLAAGVRVAPSPDAPVATLHTCWDDHNGPDGTHADGSPCRDKATPLYRAPSPDAPGLLRRNVLIHDNADFVGEWVAIPREDFDAARAALALPPRDALDVEREAVVEAMERDGVVTWGDDGHRERFLAMLPVHLARLAREYAKGEG